MTSDDIEFEFEGFLEENEENLPEGLDAEYMAYVPILENPFGNLRQLPKALVNLPMNAVLHQNWKTVLSLFSIILIMAIPNFAFLIYTASLAGKAGIGITFIFLILLGVFASFGYMKYIYGSLNNLMESRKAPWLVEKIRRQYDSNYQRNWSRRLFTLSMILPLFMEIPLVFVALSELNFNFTLIGVGFWGLMIALGHIGIGLMMFISLLSYRYINVNTRIYDQVLQTITDRVKGYTDGHESILNKKNYEVVGVLSDTPGLSIRSLGDIPSFGLAAGIFSVNALIFLFFSPILLWDPVADFIAARSLEPSSDPNGLNLVIILGIAISSIASFGAVIGPLIRITRVMVNFRNKALTELDPFIFDEITGVALKRETEIADETQVLFMIRSYIYSMKVSPVNPFRLVQIVALSLLYGYRGIPVIIGMINILGSIFGVA